MSKNLRSAGSGVISFGMVSIPVKLYTAAGSEAVSFNLLHSKCGARIRQQRVCQVCDGQVVENEDLIKGYEVAKDQYAHFSAEELKSLEAEAGNVEITEFVPLAGVDPVYFEKSFYLGPDKGGEKPYRLLAEAMAKSGKAALAKYVMRGKDNLILIRAANDGLMLHTMYFHDEVRDFNEVPRGEAKISNDERKLALELINSLSTDEFNPESFHDDYRKRVLEVAEQKVAGKPVKFAKPAQSGANAADLMAALKESLAKKQGAKSKGKKVSV